MRIAIASDDREHVASHTGRCQGFAIYETDEAIATPVEYRENGFTAHAQGLCTGEHAKDGQEHHSHGPLLDAIADCGALISRGMGPRLLADLTARGILPCICSADNVTEASRQFVEGQIQHSSRSGCCRHDHTD